ncbi:hypothetical protein ISN76_15115 [Dyella halodurans]|uniref:Uncharacterized protein n=1 Tax=Dyella halodurans TaxID=1920171 RepID=A0ABV9C652_9GAMM|nr:hypothetical protein [Dyella halodurans]
MAVHDHTAPARLSFSSSGDPFAASPAADPLAQSHQAHSPRHATLDEVAQAHHALAQLWFDDERYRVAKARCLPRQAHTWPLPPLFKEGVSLAIRCLEQYAKQLGDKQAMNG